MIFRKGLLPAVLMLAGCVVPAGSTYTRSFTISGGETIEFTFENGLVPAENADVKINAPGLEVNGSLKTVTYDFAFVSKTGRAPRSVIVEDVSGPQAEILVEDDHPVLDGKNWRRSSGPKTADDPRLGWLDEPDDTFRIYRFTVMTDDGRKFALYTGVSHTAASKDILKKTLGLDVKAAPKPAPAN